MAPEDEGRRETLSTLGNGLFATRGAAPESNADGVHCPGTYAAGVYNRLVSTVAGRQLEHESLVNLPNWLPLTFRADEGPWFGSPEIDVLTYSQRLDLSHGMLTRRIRVRDPSDRQTSVVERRIVHMAEPHLAALEWVITPENWTGSLLDGEVENRNVVDHRSLAGRHLRAVATGEATPGTCWLEVETTQSHLRCVVAARTTVMIEDRPQPVERSLYRSGQRIGHKLVLDVKPGETVVVEKVVSLFTAHDHAISEPRIAAIEALAVADSFDRMLHSHQLEWEHLWRRCDLRLGDGESETARTLNLHVFHVLQTLSRDGAFCRDESGNPR